MRCQIEQCCCKKLHGLGCTEAKNVSAPCLFVIHCMHETEGREFSDSDTPQLFNVTACGLLYHALSCWFFEGIG
jgi:hypothetical protein